MKASADCGGMHQALSSPLAFWRLFGFIFEVGPFPLGHHYPCLPFAVWAICASSASARAGKGKGGAGCCGASCAAGILGQVGAGRSLGATTRISRGKGPNRSAFVYETGVASGECERLDGPAWLPTLDEAQASYGEALVGKCPWWSYGSSGWLCWQC